MQFAFAAHRVVADVDVELGLVRLVEVTTAQDVGKAMQPAVGRRPDPGRHDAGHRAGADGGDPGPRRPDPEPVVHRLPHPHRSSTRRRCRSTSSSSATRTPRTGCEGWASRRRSPRPRRSCPRCVRRPVDHSPGCRSTRAHHRYLADEPRRQRLHPPRQRARGRGRPALAAYPGDSGARQPVHTVYVPGDRFTAGLADEWGALALARARRALPDAARTRRRARRRRRPSPPRCCLGCGRSWPPNRSRTCASTSRTATARAPMLRRMPRPGAAAGALAARHACRSAGSGSRVSKRPPGGAGCAPSTCSWGRCSVPRRCPMASW